MCGLQMPAVLALDGQIAITGSYETKRILKMNLKTSELSIGKHIEIDSLDLYNEESDSD